MSQAVVDPDELRQFAASLRNFNANLAESASALEAQFNQLGDTWRDQEQAKFAAEFEQTMRVIHQFQQTSEEHIPFLLRKADEVDQYLGR